MGANCNVMAAFVNQLSDLALCVVCALVGELFHLTCFYIIRADHATGFFRQFPAPDLPFHEVIKLNAGKGYGWAALNQFPFVWEVFFV